MRKMKTTIILIVALLLITSGCSSSASSSNEDSITIGYVGGLSGAMAAFGIPTYEAIEYAVEEINAVGGINGKTVNLVKEDDEGNPFKGQQAIEKFASEDIQFVISGSVSAIALSQVAKVKENDMLAISPMAADPQIPEENPHFFINMLSSNQFGWASAYYAANELNSKEMIVFVREDSYGLSVRDAFKEKYEELGGKIVKEYKYPVDAKDFNSYLSQAINQNPNATIFLTGHTTDSALIAKQARANGYDKPILSTNPMTSPQYLDIAGDAANATIVTAGFFADGDLQEESANFIKKWQEEFNLEPNVYQVQGYDAVYLLKKAIEDAGNTEIKKVQEGLLNIKDYKGASGTTTFNDDGSSTRPVFMIKWEEDELKYIQTLEPGSF